MTAAQEKAREKYEKASLELSQAAQEYLAALNPTKEELDEAASLEAEGLCDDPEGLGDWWTGVLAESIADGRDYFR